MGNTAIEALLYARLNQISFDKVIKPYTISCKTNVVEIDIDLDKINKDSSYIIMAIHFAHAYYRSNYISSNDRKYMYEINSIALSPQKYYEFLQTYIGIEHLNQIMDIYGRDSDEVCIAIRVEDNVYKFMY